MALYALAALCPTLDPTAWVAPGAHLIGQVQLGPDSSIWFGAILRADHAAITLGSGSQIQDGAVVHTDPGFPVQIGANVSIGHQAMLHGCTIGDGCLIGIQAMVLNGADIGPCCLIGAGTLILEKQIIPPRSLVLGSPGRVVRSLSPEEIARLQGTAQNYVTRARAYRQTLSRLDP